MMNLVNGALRVDLRMIADLVTPAARVLDVGCGDGALLDWLGENKGVDGRGIELSMAGVSAAVSQGLSVIQGDADTDLAFYPNDAFDYVILSQTLQATREPRRVIENMLRIGRHAIVSFPNFGHWRVRWDLLFKGRMPITDNLSYEWYETPNIHFCTIRDFHLMCNEMGVTVERRFLLDRDGVALGGLGANTFGNLLATQALFQLTRLG